MNARFPGTCKACGMPFPAGTSILWQNKSAIHADAQDCLGRPEERAQPSAETLSALERWNSCLKWERKHGAEWQKVPGGQKSPFLSHLLAIARQNGFVSPSQKEELLAWCQDASIPWQEC